MELHDDATFRDFFEQAEVPLCLLGPDGTIVDANHPVHRECAAGAARIAEPDVASRADGMTAAPRSGRHRRYEL